MKRILILTLLLCPALSSAAVKTETIIYKLGTTELEGFVAWDDALTDKRPGVLVVHEWMGLNDFSKKKAVQLAQMGYVAFAPDIFGKGVRPTTPEEAGQTAGIYKNDRALTRARADAAFKLLQQHTRVDATRLGAIGFCFGGMVALELARAGADLKGVVSFHGSLNTPNPADAKNVKGRLLILHGAADPHVPKAEVDAFVKEMDDAKVDWQMNLYSGAAHAFMNPDAGNDPKKGAAYNEKVADRAWAAMKIFFDEAFKTVQR